MNISSAVVAFPVHGSFLTSHPFSVSDNELLYRNRDGDVVRLSVDSNEQTVLVHNKKFVSPAHP